MSPQVVIVLAAITLVPLLLLLGIRSETGGVRASRAILAVLMLAWVVLAGTRGSTASTPARPRSCANPTGNLAMLLAGKSFAQVEENQGWRNWSWIALDVDNMEEACLTPTVFASCNGLLTDRDRAFNRESVQRLYDAFHDGVRCK